MESTWEDKVYVASIDFGTTHSGFALSILSDYEKDKTSIITHMWKSGDHPSTTKTPTCVLLNPNKTFDSFGYDAEQKYASLVEKKEHQSWYYFRRFKMKLFDSKTEHPLSLNSCIKDAEGREFSALKVFSYSIEYLKNKIIEIIKERIPTFLDDELYFVLTTPAIWSERSKQFMRKAAEKANIPSDHLRIALEPECAAVYVKTKELPLLVGTASGNKTLQPGSCYMVIDLGGGTLDITAYKVNDKDRFEEIMTPDGGPWGGDNINMSFEAFLLTIVGGYAYANFQTSEREDFLDLQRQFELKKCKFQDQADDVITVRIPESLRYLHKEVNCENLSQSIRQTKYSDSIRIHSEKMRIDNGTFKSFFDGTVDNILLKIKEILDNIHEKIDTLICVGGFSDCKLIKHVIKNKFTDKTVIIPNEAVSSIMKGAIIYARDTSIIETRRCRYTYGLDWNEDFDSTVHPSNKKERTDDGDMCKDVFLKLISRNDGVSVNTPAKEIEAFKKWRHQNVIDFPFYRSEYTNSPKFIDDLGCQHVGTLSVNVPDLHINHCVKLKVYFGATELRAEAVDESGRKYKATFNLFESQM